MPGGAKLLTPPEVRWGYQAPAQLFLRVRPGTVPQALQERVKSLAPAVAGGPPPGTGMVFPDATATSPAEDESSGKS